MKKELSKYFEAVGRRKTSTARVRIFLSSEGFDVNGSDYKAYFKTSGQKTSAEKPLKKMTVPEKVGISVKVSGGGLASQADAVSLGIARAIVKMNPDQKSVFHASGLLTRDPRAVERKKYGLKKARRAPQWAKR
ncbi:MAG: 30S ribosomal protein S9 [Candidatus Colwellbacteria bacterium]|nr:30S ribosomal protein S9 [Candidatus Colwellbacteria bacterium]